MNGPTGLIFYDGRYERPVLAPGDSDNEVGFTFSGQDGTGFDLTRGFSDGDVGLGIDPRSGPEPTPLQLEPV